MFDALPLSLAYTLSGNGPKAERRQALAAWVLSVILRAGLLFLGGLLLWRGGFDGRTGWELYAGMTLLALAGLLRAPLALIGAVSTIWAFRHFLFLLWLLRGAAGMTWTKTILAYTGTALWEALPYTTALVVGLLLARRIRQGWVVMLITAAVWSGLACWVPRPYAYALAGPLFDALPSLTWTFGSDLLGGLLLGWTLMVLRWTVLPTTAREAGLVLLSTGVLLTGLHLTYENWINRSSGMAREVVKHDVIAVPGAMPPFAANFALQSERIIYPMIFNSSMLPDLVMAPENMIQVNPATDPKDDNALLQRITTAIGIGIGVPYSQALYGVRDYQTSRIYFTDIKNNKPRVLWKDLEKRIPGIDTPLPGKLQRWLHGGVYVPEIRQAELTPLMAIWKRRPLLEKDSSQNLEHVADALICMSGELRDPRLVLKVVGKPTVTAVMNPNISGWLGLPEGTSSSVQAKARLLELGMLGYRVGQNSGTELVVPWSLDGIPTSMDPAKTFLRFEAPLPRVRLATGYTFFGYYLALFLVPSAGFILLVMLLLGRFSKTRAYGIA